MNGLMHTSFARPFFAFSKHALALLPAVIIDCCHFGSFPAAFAVHCCNLATAELQELSLVVFFFSSKMIEDRPSCCSSSISALYSSAISEMRLDVGVSYAAAEEMNMM